MYALVYAFVYALVYALVYVLGYALRVMQQNYLTKLDSKSWQRRLAIKTDSQKLEMI